MVDNEGGSEGGKLPIKSPEDKKEYRFIKLKNGLEALLISEIAYSVKAKNPETAEERKRKIELFNQAIQMAEKARLKKLNPGFLDRLKALLVKSPSETDESQEMETEDDEDPDPEVRKKKRCAKIRRELRTNSIAQDFSVVLSIGAGHYFNPCTPENEIFGLAHLLEHMMFQGSKNHPEPGQKLIESLNGNLNAHTENTFTYFVLNAPVFDFEKCLEILVDLIKNPILDEKCIEAQIKVVDHEWAGKKQGEEYQIYDLLATTAKKNHPCSKYTFGNAETLNKHRKRMREELKKFHEKYYTPDKMKLVIQGPMSLDFLEFAATTYFSVIEESLVKIELVTTPLPYDTEEFKKLYKINSYTNSLEMYISWGFPKETTLNYKSNPLKYIEYIFTSEEDYGLSCYLRKNNLIVKAPKFIIDSNEALCCVTYNLTMSEYGLENYIYILDAIYSFIEFLKDKRICEDVFFNMQDVGLGKFHLKDHSKRSINDIAKDMLTMDPTDLLMFQDFITKFDQESIKATLGLMTPRKMNLMLFSSKYTNITDKIEHYSGLKYKAEHFTETQLCRLENLEENMYFALPPKNDYLSYNFSLLKPETSCDISEFPTKLNFEGSHIELWYRMSLEDTSARYSLMLTNKPLFDAKGYAYIDLWILILEEQLSCIIWKANQADYEILITPTEFGLEVQVSGNQEKVSELFKEVAIKLNSMVVLTEGKYKNFKSQLMSKYLKNINSNESYGRELKEFMITNGFYTSMDKLNAFEHSCYLEFSNFMYDFKQHVSATLLIQGNELRSKAKKFGLMINMGFDLYERYCINLPNYKKRVIPKGEKCLQVKTYDPENDTFFLENVYQIGAFNLKDYFILSFIHRNINTTLMNELRTKQLLAYETSFQVKESDGVLYAFITLSKGKTDEFTADEINLKVDEFLEKFYKKLERTTKTLEVINFFEGAVGEEIGKLQVRKNERFWAELKYSGSFFTERNEKLKNLMKNVPVVKREDVLSFYKNHFFANIRGRPTDLKKFSIQVVGTKTEGEQAKKKKAVKFDNIILVPDKTPERAEKFITEFASIENLPLYPRKKYRATQHSSSN